MRILILGAAGMLGNAMFRLLGASPDLDVHGSIRSSSSRKFFEPDSAERLEADIDVENSDALVSLLARRRPDVVVNCIGLVKQLSTAEDPLVALPINAMLPHRLSHLCAMAGARLIHFSTDCVFSGDRGSYKESDVSDARDLYGKSKFIGEVDAPHAITLRTSIIGPEISPGHSLLNWFLAQSGVVKGYSRAIFSGLPTVEIAQVVRDVVLHRADLHGVYHVASTPISKLDLLRLIASAYNKPINIIPDDQIAIDRSLDGTRFFAATGYIAADWVELIRRMREFHFGASNVQ